MSHYTYHIRLNTAERLPPEVEDTLKELIKAKGIAVKPDLENWATSYYIVRHFNINSQALKHSIIIDTLFAPEPDRPSTQINPFPQLYPYREEHVRPF